MVRATAPRLRKSDRKVAEVVLADPRRILTSTVAQVSAFAGVSQPTVIRFATAVGCAGFRDFKLRLAESLALGTPATHSAILDSDGPDTVLQQVFDYTIASLDRARRALDPAAVAQAVDILAGARTIEFFGLGASGVVALDAQQKFPLFGVPCGAQQDTHQQIMIASMMGPRDVAVVVSNTGATRSIAEVARVAREGGARVVGLLGTASIVAAHCDVVLLVTTPDNTDVYTPTTSRIAALVVVDVLATGVALRRDPEQRSRLAAMKRRLSDLRSSWEI